MRTHVKKQNSQLKADIYALQMWNAFRYSPAKTLTLERMGVYLLHKQNLSDCLKSEQITPRMDCFVLLNNG